MTTEHNEHKKKKGGTLILVAALLLYGLATVIAFYIGTIAIMPQGAFLTIAMFALATYALWAFFRKRTKPQGQDLDLTE